MPENEYSEDYKQLLAYKENINPESDSEILDETVNFFFEKYEYLIKAYYKKLKKQLSKGSLHSSNLDYEEYADFSVILPKRKYFDEKIKSKYIPQALKSFNPLIITNKETYCFATYMYNYLRHAVRDIASEWMKKMYNSNIEAPARTVEESALQADEHRRIKEAVNTLQAELEPLEALVLDELIEGKKQKDIIIINKRTGKRYSKGYISKLVKTIRFQMKELLEP